MTVLKGAAGKLSYIPETAWGTTPDTPVFKTLEFESESMTLNRNSLMDQSINTTRNRRFHDYGVKGAVGDISGNLIYAQWDEFISSALFNDWNAIQAAVTITNATTLTFGSDVSATYPVGTIVALSDGASGIVDGDLHTVSAITAVNPSVATVDTMGAASGTVDVAAFVKNGVTEQSVTVERMIEGYSDPDLYFRYTGCVVNNMSLTVSPDDLIKASFGLVGKTEDTIANTIISGATYADVSDLGSSPMVGLNGWMTEGGIDGYASPNNYITGFTLNIDNGITQANSVGNEAAIDLIPGIHCVVTGTISLYIDGTQGEAEYNKFVNGTESQIALMVTDPNSGANEDDTYMVVLPAVKYTGASAPIASSGAIVNNMPFEAISTGTGSVQWTIMIARWPATDA